MSLESAEHRPELDIEVSRAKLQNIVETQIEVSEETLFNSVQDMLSSRAGERWKRIDEYGLSTKAGLSVVVGYNEPVESEPWESVWVQVTQRDETRKIYEVRKRGENGASWYELGEVDDLESEVEEFTPVSNYGDLAPARLLSILADAHSNTPLQELNEDDFAAA